MMHLNNEHKTEQKILEHSSPLNSRWHCGSMLVHRTSESHPTQQSSFQLSFCLFGFSEGKKTLTRLTRVQHQLTQLVHRHVLPFANYYLNSLCIHLLCHPIPSTDIKEINLDNFSPTNHYQMDVYGVAYILDNVQGWAHCNYPQEIQHYKMLWAWNRSFKACQMMNEAHDVCEMGVRRVSSLSVFIYITCPNLIAASQEWKLARCLADLSGPLL